MKSSSNASSDQSWGLTIDQNGELDLRINVGGTWNRVQAPGVISPNTWYHVAFTVDAAGTGTLYVNGEVDGTAGGFEALPEPNAVGATSWGGSPDGAKDFPGIILDDSRFYGSALSAEQIKVLASQSYSLDVTVDGQGSVNFSPEGGEYVEGTTVELTAVPNDGFKFVDWKGDIESMDNPLTVTMDSDISLTASFEIIKHALTVNIVGNGTVTPGSGEYSGVMALTAVPDDGWAFDSWSGDMEGTDNPGFIEMNAAKTVTATFIDISGIDDPEMNAYGLTNYPNPFTGKTTVSYTLKQDSDVELIVFDTFGKKVKELVNQSQNPGDYKVELDGSDLENGIYFYQFRSGGQSVTKKMILSK
jgi:hypothetical protein